jgi:hypothetical protein
MTFPALNPTSRQFSPGDWPVKTYKAQSGAEVRILYGNRRTEMKLELTYDNITDTQANQFLTHFDSVLGTFQTFVLSSAAKIGWGSTASSIDVSTGANWRYASEPQITAIRPGISSVRVNLIGVL